MRERKPCGSCSYARSCRNTRIELNPSPLAQPSSRSIVGRSKVSACHISSWLMAVEGLKFAPASQGFFAYHSFARWADHCCWAWTDREAINITMISGMKRDVLMVAKYPDRPRELQEEDDSPRRHGDTEEKRKDLSLLSFLRVSVSPCFHPPPNYFPGSPQKSITNTSATTCLMISTTALCSGCGR